jgi:hypothetical protein
MRRAVSIDKEERNTGRLSWWSAKLHPLATKNHISSVCKNPSGLPRSLNSHPILASGWDYKSKISSNLVQMQIKFLGHNSKLPWYSSQLSRLPRATESNGLPPLSSTYSDGHVTLLFIKEKGRNKEVLRNLARHVQPVLQSNNQQFAFGLWFYGLFCSMGYGWHLSFGCKAVLLLPPDSCDQHIKVWRYGTLGTTCLLWLR